MLNRTTASRRGFLLQGAAALGMALVPASAAHALHPAGHDLWAALGRFPWTEEGAGSHLFYILFEPTCPFAPHQYETTRSLLHEARFRWIAFPNRSPASLGSAARMASSRSARDLSHLMNHGASSFASHANEWRALMLSRTDIQVLERDIYPLLRSYGGSVGISSPTSVFMNSRGRPRLAKGAWSLEQYREFIA